MKMRKITVWIQAEDERDRNVADARIHELIGELATELPWVRINTTTRVPDVEEDES